MKPIFFSLLLFISLPGWAQIVKQTDSITQQSEDVSDSIRNVDSLFVVALMLAEQYYINLESDPYKFWTKFSGAWELTPASNDTSQHYQVSWNENGALLIQRGKKKKSTSGN